jgi:hypothetical protein
MTANALTNKSDPSCMMMTSTGRLSTRQARIGARARGSNPIGRPGGIRSDLPLFPMFTRRGTVTAPRRARRESCKGCVKGARRAARLAVVPLIWTSIAPDTRGYRESRGQFCAAQVSQTSYHVGRARDADHWSAANFDHVEVERCSCLFAFSGRSW